MSRGKKKKLIKIGLPKGSLQESTLNLFEKAGYNIHVSSRSYRPIVNDPEIEIRLLRAQEIGRYVDQGFLDCGLTGKDWIVENRAKVDVLCDLAYSKATSSPTRWVLVVPEKSPIKKPEQLEGKRIATEAVSLVQQYLRKRKIKATVEFSWGATEVKVPELVDAIVDITETGSSLRANNLRIIDTLMESYPQFVANRESAKDAWKRGKMDRLVLMLQGSLNARDKVGVKMNVPAEAVEKVLDALPSMRNPTVSHLAHSDWMAVETVLDEKVIRELIPRLKQVGAEDIIEYPLNKVIH